MAELRALRDCGVIRCVAPRARERFGRLVTVGWAEVAVDRFAGVIVATYRLSSNGRQAAALLR